MRKVVHLFLMGFLCAVTFPVIPLNAGSLSDSQVLNGVLWCQNYGDDYSAEKEKRDDSLDGDVKDNTIEDTNRDYENKDDVVEEDEKEEDEKDDSEKENEYKEEYYESTDK